MKFIQFNTRTLLLFVALVGVGLAVYRWTTRTERAVSEIRNLGGQVEWVDVEWGPVYSSSSKGRPLSPEEQHYTVYIDSAWRGGRDGLRLLGDLPHLRSVSIDTPVGDAELVQLAQHRELEFLYFRAGDDTASGLTLLPRLPSLWRLSIAGAALTGAAFEGLEPFPSLTSLDLIDTTIDDRALIGIRSCPNLQELSLAGTAVTDAGMALLNPRLEILSLSRTRITDDGLAQLAALPNLRRLVLRKTSVTDAGLSHLATLPKLEYVDASDTSVTRAGALALVKATDKRVEVDIPTGAPGLSYTFTGEDLDQSKETSAETTIVIEHCSVFDPESGKMTPDQTIVIRDAKIERVVAAGAIGELPADAQRIDGSGKFALPGLIDAHVHVVHVLDFAHVTGDEVLPLYLAAGVTSVRSTGDEPVAATLVARFAAAHPESCPRVFTCSPLLDADPPIHRDVGRAITDPAKVPALFDDLARWQPKTVKIYAGTGRPVGRAIIEESHRRGLFVTAHLGAYSAQDAVADGVDGLEHIWSVFNYVIPPEVAKTPGHRGRLDLGNPLCEALLAELAKRKVYVDPTLAVFRHMILLSDVDEGRNPRDVAVVPKRLREFWPEYLRKSGCPQGGPLEDRRREFAKFQELTGKLYRAGVPLLAGTDSPEPNVPPGFSLHQELQMLVESGLPSAAALRAATLTNATVVGEQERLGSIAAGKLADIVLLSANPLDDIRNTREIELVIRGGRLCRPAELLTRVPRE